MINYLPYPLRLTRLSDIFALKILSGQTFSSRTALRSKGPHLLPRRSRWPALFLARRHGAFVQDLRRLQGSHGCAVDAGRCLRRAEFPGDIPPECLRRGGHRISGSCSAKSVLNEVIKRHPMFALKLFSSFSERLRQSEKTIEGLLEGRYQRVWPRCSRTSATASGA